MKYEWKRTFKRGTYTWDDYVTVDYKSTKRIEIHTNIKGIRSYHEYNINILAFLIKQLYS